MTVSAVRRGSDAAEIVAWHELECGGYRADLGLWLEIARHCGDPVLDVGAGSGRVALALARDGHEVVAVDREPALLAALRKRAGALPVTTVTADARELALDRRFACCLVPMQTVQLLGGSRGRDRFLRRARRHLRPGGLLAAALLPEQLDEFDLALGDAPDAERFVRDGVHYASRPTALRVTRHSVVIERRRERRPPGGEPVFSDDVIALDRISARQLAAEARRAGFAVEDPREIAATSEHVGSEVVMLRA